MIHPAVNCVVCVGADRGLQVLCDSHDNGVDLLNFRNLRVGLFAKRYFPHLIGKVAYFFSQTLHIGRWLADQMFRPCGRVWRFTLFLCFHDKPKKMDPFSAQISDSGLFL